MHEVDTKMSGWVERLTTPEFEKSFQKHFEANLQENKGLIARHYKVHRSGTKISVELAKSEGSETFPGYEGGMATDIEGVSGIRRIAAEAAKDAFKMAIGDMKSYG